MSGEILGEVHYFDLDGEGDDTIDDDDDDDVPGLSRPTHSFWHDLASILWILFWYCIGPAMRREPLWAPPTRRADSGIRMTGSSILQQTLFLAFNKANTLSMDWLFEATLRQVSQWCTPLKPLLRQLRNILLKGYKAHDFSAEQTYGDFMAAFQAAEEVLLQEKTTLAHPLRQHAYHVEVARCEADRMEWQLPSRVLVNTAPLEVEMVHYTGESEADEPALGSLSDREEGMCKSTHDPAPAFAAALLAPDASSRSNSPTEHSTAETCPSGCSPSPTARRLSNSKYEPTADDSSTFIS